MPDFIRHIPIILVVFILFLVFVNMRYRKSNKETKEREDAFWERERMANATRRKDITNLPYITIPKEILPQSLHTSAIDKLKALAESEDKILNLTGKSNTDLKLEYGVANLEELSACDERFTLLVTALSEVAKDLLEAKQTDEAKAILEFAVKIQADAKSIYLMLAQLYCESNETAKIDSLIASAGDLNSLSKNSIIAELNARKEQTPATLTE